MSVTITVDDKPVIDYLNRLLEKTGDLTPVMNHIGAELEARIANRFETRSDPLGAPWAPLAASTKKSYPEDGLGFVLERYGDMLRSLSHSADATSVTVGFGQPYAAFHEFGTKHMPRRGLLTEDPESGTLAPDDRTSVLDIITDYLGDA